MKISKYIHKGISVLLCMVFGIACFSTPAFARKPLDVNKNTALTIQYPCPQAEFRIFRVASVSTYAEYTLVGDFKNYAVSLSPADQEGWRTLASTLSGYVERDKLSPQKSGKTDAQGNLTFSELTPGLYLVLGETSTYNKEKYTPTPFLVALPSLDNIDNWITEVTAAPKYTREPVKKPGGGSDKETVTRKVMKIWKNDDRNERPKQIEVQLLRNGKVWDTVHLSEKNNWRHEWKDLDKQYTWQVVEKTVPSGYTVTVELDGSFFVVTNSMKKPEQPETPETPETPNTPDTPETPEIPDKPNVPETPNKPNIPNTPADVPPTVPETPSTPTEKTSLPQTGALWWPVGIMAAGGTVLLILGVIWKGQRRDTDEKK